MAKPVPVEQRHHNRNCDANTQQDFRSGAGVGKTHSGNHFSSTTTRRVGAEDQEKGKSISDIDLLTFNIPLSFFLFFNFPFSFSHHAITGLCGLTH
jgi:hypothetical protein